MARGESLSHAADLVAHAIELGINFIDTASAYGTEQAVGLGVKGKRDQVIISTKASLGRGEEPISAARLVASLDKSLARLQTDYVDIFHLHGLRHEQLEQAYGDIVPELVRQQEKGKIRFLGATESFIVDTNHQMFEEALIRDCFDVIMVGFNLLNPSARNSIFPLTEAQDVGTLIMFAVRRALSQPAALLDELNRIVAAGQWGGNGEPTDAALDFVVDHQEVASLVEAAYRFCRYEPGAHVILTGTGSRTHLEDNIRSILAPPLPDEILSQLAYLFGAVDSVSGN